MIEVEMSKDVREFEPKILGPFTKRQTICIIIACVIALPVIFIMRGYGFSMETILMVAAICAIPPIICGFTKAYGLPFEVYFLRYFIGYMMKPTYRKYKTQNTFSIWEDKKEYLDKKGNPRKMKYKKSKKYIGMK